MGFNCCQVNISVTDSLLIPVRCCCLSQDVKEWKAQCCSMPAPRDDQQYAVDNGEQTLALMANAGTVRQQIVLFELQILLLSLFISDLYHTLR